MAYSGLGSGTVGDPYQIITIAQFNEMSGSGYAGVYFLLKNNLDCTGIQISIANFYCKLNGGGFSLNNIVAGSSAFYLANSSSITNLKLNYVETPTSNGNGIYIFNYQTSSTLTGISLTNIVITNNFIRQTNSQRLFNGSLSSTCTINNWVIDGCFERLLDIVLCSINIISILNTYTGPCPIVYNTIGSASILENFQYHKPITLSLTTDNIYFIVNSLTSGCIIRKGFINVGKVSTLGSFSFISYSVSLASGVYKIEDVGLIATSIYAGASDRNWLIHGYNQALTGTTNSINNIFFDGDFNTPNQITRTELMDFSHKATACFYNSDALVSIPDTNYSGQTGLTSAQYKTPSNFSGWDFSTVWQMGASRPQLINVPTYPSFINSPDKAYLYTPTRISANGYSNSIGIQIFRNSGTNYGMEIYDPNNNLIDSTVSTDFFNFNLLDVDKVYTIKFYSLANSVKSYITSIVYAHYCYNAAIDQTKIICASTTVVNNGTNQGNLLHGSLLYNNYLYGSTRNVQSGSPSVNGCIFKAPTNDVSNYTLIPVYLSAANLKSCNMDSLVEIGGYFFSCATSTFTDNSIYIIKFNPITDDYQVYKIAGTAANGAPSCTDGTFLYIYAGAHTAATPSVIKIDPTVFNSVSKFNVASNWVVNAVIYPYAPNRVNLGANPHTMCVDSTYLYVGFGTSANGEAHDVHKILKSNMTYVSRALVPKMTDDMCQTATHLFVGIELLFPSDPGSYGYGWGTCAIRKADMVVTALPLLHSTDISSSYASLIFGNYLIDLKTNGYIYALDITDVDNWSLNENLGKRTLKAYNMYKPGGTLRFNASPINEVMLPDSGLFVGFAWASPSMSVSFELPGLNFFTPPSVTTDDSAIIDDDSVSLSATILDNGGRPLTACGVIVGQQPNLSDGIGYPVTPVVNVFEQVINNLGTGIYYWRAYATNTVETGYGNIKSFEILNPYTDPGTPTALTNEITINVELAWSAPIDLGGATLVGFKIERKPAEGEWAVIVANTNTADLTYTDTVAVGSYIYRISTITTYSTGLPSEEFAVTATIGGGGVGNYRIFLGSTEIAVM